MERGARSFFPAVAAYLVIVCAPAAHAVTKRPLPQVDHIIIVKSERTMTLMRQGQVLKTFKIALGHEPIGPKVQQGDERTPEGMYTIDSRNPRSQFHLALHISYPNAADRERAKKLGVSAGGDIMIHGLPPAFAWLGPLHRRRDWTLGCVAVTDPEIEEIWNMVPNGTKVEIKP
jgi:murein L,D-transpeptidase YafK